jgi:hypothetical protein
MYLVITIIMGLLSRSSYIPQTSFIGTYAGDTLWALAVSLGLGLALFGIKARYIFTVSLLFSFAIEILQLYHASWIDTFRSDKIGALVLGSGFLWSDLICYTVGVTIGVVVYYLHLLRSNTDRRVL